MHYSRLIRHAGGSHALLVVIAILLALGVPAWPQHSTSTVLGTVVDAQGGTVAGASVALINEGTSDQRTVTSDNSGNFLFPNVLPGTYTAKVESQGFQTYRKQGIFLSAQERLSLGTIQLTVGS